MGIFDKVPFVKKKSDDPFANPPNSGGISGIPSGMPGIDDPFKQPMPDSFSGKSYDDPFSSKGNMGITEEPDVTERSVRPIGSQEQLNLPGKHAGGYAEQGNDLSIQHQMELILSKLDTIKMSVENINLRISKIENDIQKKGKEVW